MHLFELFDEDFLKYMSMFLALGGILKNNFLTETMLGEPSQFDIASLVNINYDIASTQGLIAALGQISKGVLALASLLAFGSNLLDFGFLPDSDLVPLFWNLTLFSFLFYGAITGLMSKYGLQAILNDLTPEAARSGIIEYVMINYLPDFFLSVIPLYMTFLRLD